MSFWFECLLVNPVTQELRDSFPETARAEGMAFLEQYPKEVPELFKSDLDLWYQSTEGQAALVEAFQLIWAQMNSVAHWAMPAHDARHAIYKVPATALEYLHAEGVTGYERVGILGALLHDHGRWAEERLYGGPGPGLLHARMSFLLGRELLAQVAMPDWVRSQILHAVLQHTSGARETDAMPTKLTVVADRDQLYGPEIILRLMHHLVQDGALGSVYGENGGEAVLDKLEYFCRNRLPGPLYSRLTHVHFLRKSLLTFLLMAESYHESAARFVPEQGLESKKKLIDDVNWAEAWEEADFMRPVAHDPRQALESLLNAPNIAPGAEFLEMALAKLDHLDPSRAERLAGALTWVTRLRQAEDVRQAEALADIRQAYPEDALIGIMVDTLLEKW